MKKKTVTLVKPIRFGDFPRGVPYTIEFVFQRLQDDGYGLNFIVKGLERRITVGYARAPLPVDPTLWWRFRRLLEAAAVIDFSDLEDALCALRRSDTYTLVLEDMGISEQTYLAIMTAPIPEEVLAEAEALEKEGLLDKASLSDEIAAGTLPWSQRVADLGVRHPHQVDQMMDWMMQVLKRYENVIGGISAERGGSDDFLASLKAHIALGVSYGVEDEYGRDVVFAVAVAAAIVQEMLEQDDDALDETVVVGEAADWARKLFRRSSWWPFPIRSHREYMRLIREIMEKAPKLPTKYPMYSAVPIHE